jgi:hypothetical protein
VQDFGNKTTTGVVGIAFLFPMLDKYGYGETVCTRYITPTSCPF